MKFTTEIDPAHLRINAENRERMDFKTEVFEINDRPHEVSGHPAKMLPGLSDTLIEDYAGKTDRVLDPFCGVGTTLKSCQDRGIAAVGIDIESRYVDVCKTRGFDARQGSALDLPIDDGSIDVIVTSPPYGEAIGRAGDRSIEKTIAAKQRHEQKKFGKEITRHAQYGSHPENIGSIPLKRKRGPCFVGVFPRVLSECARVLRTAARKKSVRCF